MTLRQAHLLFPLVLAACASAPPPAPPITLARSELAAKAALLGGPPPGPSVLREMTAAGELVLEVDGSDQVWAYRPQTAALEAELAQVRAAEQRVGVAQPLRR